MVSNSGCTNPVFTFARAANPYKIHAPLPPPCLWIRQGLDMGGSSNSSSVKPSSQPLAMARPEAVQGNSPLRKSIKSEPASARARELYQAKGYPQAWIEKRLRSISVCG